MISDVFWVGWGPPGGGGGGTTIGPAILVLRLILSPENVLGMERCGRVSKSGRWSVRGPHHISPSPAELFACEELIGCASDCLKSVGTYS